jgi:hypothetical protein
MRPQRAISLTVRRQPLQQLRSSRTHTLMQGEVGPDRAIRCRPPAPRGVELWGCVAYSSNDFQRPCPRATIPAGAAEFTLGGLQHEPIEYGSWRDHDRIRRCDHPVAGPALARWLHIVAGVMWIGLLYYFNVVQIPALADAGADKGGPVAPASRSMSRRARCSGSAGRRWPPGSPVPWLLGSGTSSPPSRWAPRSMAAARITS